ncbi:MAG: MerR family transcriptional regulator [Ferruginibacter sp.]
MGLQQSSFDFFNIPPEPPRSEEKAMTEIQKPSPVIEALEVEETPVADEILIVDEDIREVEFIAEEPATAPYKKAVKKSTRGRMKLSDMDVLVDLVEVPDDEILFQKRYYPISAVSEMFKVNISLIRFWENEFTILKPKKNGKGDRLFRPEDIKNLQLIYHLLREKKYTIDGAKDFLKKNKKADETFELIDSLKKTKAFLLDLKANL